MLAAMRVEDKMAEKLRSRAQEARMLDISPMWTQRSSRIVTRAELERVMVCQELTLQEMGQGWGRG